MDGKAIRHFRDGKMKRLSILGIPFLLMLDACSSPKVTNPQHLRARAEDLSSRGKPCISYKLAVVRCGVYDQNDVDRAAKDPIFRRAYHLTGPAKAEFRTADSDIQAKVGYRLGDALYRTPRRVLIKAGEQYYILNGVVGRSRCGNPIDPIGWDELKDKEGNDVDVDTETPSTPLLVESELPHDALDKLFVGPLTAPDAPPTLNPNGPSALAPVPTAPWMPPNLLSPPFVAGGFPGVIGGIAGPIGGGGSGCCCCNCPPLVVGVIGGGDEVVPTPEPGTLGGYVLGLGVFGGLLWRRRRNS